MFPNFKKIKGTFSSILKFVLWLLFGGLLYLASDERLLFVYGIISVFVYISWSTTKIRKELRVHHAVLDLKIRAIAHRMDVGPEDMEKAYTDLREEVGKDRLANIENDAENVL